jgi:hypothetical protein
MILVPIPQDALYLTAHVWGPFLEGIAKRSKCPVSQHVEEIKSGLVHLVLAWEPEAKIAKALAGLSFKKRGAETVAEIVWCTGAGRNDWFNLIHDIENYCREHHGCKAIRAIPRPGWKHALEASGYRTTHLVMERELDG